MTRICSRGCLVSSLKSNQQHDGYRLLQIHQQQRLCGSLVSSASNWSFPRRLTCCELVYEREGLIGRHGRRCSRSSAVGGEEVDDVTRGCEEARESCYTLAAVLLQTYTDVVCCCCSLARSLQRKLPQDWRRVESSPRCSGPPAKARPLSWPYCTLCILYHDRPLTTG